MATYSEFINPYIFVPLGGEVKRDDRKELLEKSGDVYTGKLQVTLKTRTPLFIPDMHGRRKEEAKHKYFTFFSYDGVNPVIPGSSLNGLLRNNYETVTNSCLSVVDMDEKPVRRTSEYYDKGLLYRDQEGNITLYKAAKATVKPSQRRDRDANNMPVEEENFYEGAPVKFTIRKTGKETLAENIRTLQEVDESDDTISGYYFKGEPGVRKHDKGKTPCNAYVFYEDEDEKETVIDGLTAASKEIRQLLDVLKSYYELSGKKSAQKGHNGYKEYSDRLKNFLQVGKGYFPVHYSFAAGRLYLSPACITKEVYYTSIKEIIEKQGKHHTCDNIHHLCPGCRLFGMVGQGTLDEKDYPNAWAGSVRVQDAVLKNEKDLKKIFGNKIMLMELGSPRKSSTEFYLQKPIGKNGEVVLSWTYDYYMAQNRNNKFQIAKYTPKISGRKFYWHHTHPNFPREFVERTDRNCTITPVRENVEFTFPVYFEKISAQQLKQLIWLCNISAEKKEGKAKYGYKIGKGKPLGLGSVELTVESVQIRCLKRQGEIFYHLESFEQLFGKSYQQVTYDEAGFDKLIKDSFLRICNFEAVGETPVTYPVGDNQSVRLAIQGFNWFGNNHYHTRGGNGKITTRNQLIFQQNLEPLGKSNLIKLRVNKDVNPKEEKDANKKSNKKPNKKPVKKVEYTSPLSWGEANDFVPAVGSKIWVKIKKIDEEYLYGEAETRNSPSFDIKVIKDSKGKYTIGSRMQVTIDTITSNEDGQPIAYEGSEVTNKRGR